MVVKPVIVPEDYPNDNDTNAVAFSILRPTDSRAKVFIDEILACKNSDGIVQVETPNIFMVHLAHRLSGSPGPKPAKDCS